MNSNGRNRDQKIMFLSFQNHFHVFTFGFWSIPMALCWMRLTRGVNGRSIVAPVDPGDAVPTSKDLSMLPSVEDTFDVARKDA